MPDVHDRAVSSNAREQARDLGHRFLRCRQPDPLERPDQRFEALQGECQVRAALVAGHGVDLITMTVARCAACAPARAGEQEVERLGGRHEDVGGRFPMDVRWLGACPAAPRARAPWLGRIHGGQLRQRS